MAEEQKNPDTRSWDWDREHIKTEKQWAKLGYEPIEGRQPEYVWDDRNGNPKTIYWHEKNMQKRLEAYAKKIEELKQG